MTNKAAKIVLLTISTALLSACGSGEFSDLQQWIDTEKAKPPGKIAALPELKPYERFLYRDADLRDPFKPVLKAVAPSNAGSALISQHNTREKEPLEEYPLDTLRMVGSLDKGAEKWAIVKSSEGLIYRVKEGQHVGKNFGEVISITDNTVVINEVISDGFGGWIEREAQLVIEE